MTSRTITGRQYFLLMLYTGIIAETSNTTDSLRAVRPSCSFLLGEETCTLIYVRIQYFRWYLSNGCAGLLGGDSHKARTGVLLSQQLNKQFAVPRKQVVLGIYCDSRYEGREVVLLFAMIVFCRFILKETRTQHISRAVLLMQKESRLVGLQV